MVALASAWHRDLDVSCGCFGRESAPAVADYPYDLARDGLFLAMALAVLWSALKKAKGGAPEEPVQAAAGTPPEVDLPTTADPS